MSRSPGHEQPPNNHGSAYERAGFLSRLKFMPITKNIVEKKTKSKQQELNEYIHRGRPAEEWPANHKDGMIGAPPLSDVDGNTEAATVIKRQAANSHKHIEYRTPPPTSIPSI